MDAQQAGSFDKKAFIAAVKAAIEAKSPKTLKEADDYTASGKAGEVKGEVLVAQGTDDQGRDIEAATEAPPDQSKAVPKPVTPMVEEQPGRPAAIPTAGAVPKPAPNEQVNLAAGTHEVNQEMAEAEVTEPQLAQSNEPEFQQALADKQAAAEHADTAPAQFRQHEQAVIERGSAEATEETTAAVAGMQGAEGTALAKLVADKGKTRSRDEAKRAEVTAKVQSIFAATEADVRKILDGIDPKVEVAFDQGEAAARSAFETYVAAKMSAYKKDRYGGWLGGLRWAKDKLLGMPAKVNEFYDAGRELYLKQMDGVISRVADIVGNDLAAAKKRIATGKAEIASYVKGLPADLRKVGAEASKEIGDSFSQLERDVDAKQESVVDSLATKYVEARKGLDERIEALQAENRGLVDKAIGAIKAVINTIRELAAMLRNVLARAAGVVGAIIKDPVGFLGNLIAGIKGGILKFKDNILTHLRKGLMGWLFGALAEGGVELPDSFDVKGIIKLLASIFGMTWANIRNRIVKRIGEKATAAAEKGVEIFQLIAGQGVAGLWQMLVDKLGDIKEMILEQVKDLVITKIITAGITWLIGLLNPAAAFIKACKLIYDVVMFFVSNAGRIMRFVNTVIDSVADIVRGNVSGVVNKINDVLGQMVPIIIGFLASLIGLGGIGQRVRQIMETLRKPFTKALDFAINTGLRLAGPIIRGLKGVSGRVKAKVAAGKAWVKGKAAAGKEWVKGKVDAGKEWAGGGKRTVTAENEKEPEPDSETGESAVLERPTVDIPFAMAGEEHKVTLAPKGADVNVTMSSQTLPLTKKFQQAHLAIDNFRQYMSTITDPEIKARYETEILPKLVAFAAPLRGQLQGHLQGTLPARCPGADVKGSGDGRQGPGATAGRSRRVAGPADPGMGSHDRHTRPHQGEDRRDAAGQGPRDLAGEVHEGAGGNCRGHRRLQLQGRALAVCGQRPVGLEGAAQGHHAVRRVELRRRPLRRAPRRLRRDSGPPARRSACWQDLPTELAGTAQAEQRGGQSACRTLQGSRQDRGVVGCPARLTSMTQTSQGVVRAPKHPRVLDPDRW
jgi:hypothetical protein